MDVELDIYSGRPNPTWKLDAEQATTLWRMLNALPELVGPARIPDGLGYRGLKINSRGDDGSSMVKVGGGAVVLVDDRGRGTARRDSGRHVERWLIETGTGALPVDLLDLLRREVGRPEKRDGR